jgi:hypothetical protein
MGAEHSATNISPQRASVLSIETSARLVVMMRRRQTLTEPDTPPRYWQRNPALAPVLLFQAWPPSVTSTTRH